jgi:cell division protein ZipA
MEASTLRWTIIVIGIMVLGAIFLFGSPEKKKKPRASRRKPLDIAERLEPTLEPVEPSPQTGEPEEIVGQGELPIGDSAPLEPVLLMKPPKPKKPPGPEPDKIVTLFLMARDNHNMGGAELLEAAIKTGMEFGDMNIFHRFLEGSDKVIFSMANAAKPGFFDKDAWNEFETGGLVVFLTLPCPILALDAWDTFLASTRRMSEILGAELNDENHQPLTRQSEGKIREEMRQYDRSQARKSLEDF